MKMGYFWRKEYDPYKENLVDSTLQKDRAVRMMSLCGDCSQFHIFTNGMCLGNVWPHGQPGILLESNKNYGPEKYHRSFWACKN